jgi:hypothetical protein
MKRAAVQWGIGRYLYRLPQQWVRLDERGRFAEPPRLPASFLPASRNGSSRHERPVVELHAGGLRRADGARTNGHEEPRRAA